MFRKCDVVPTMVTMLVGVSLSALAAAPATAQCGWCVDVGVGWFGWHSFPDGNDLCGWTDDFSGKECARCSKDKGCHTDRDIGQCHKACGPAGDVAMRKIVDRVRSALDAGEAETVAAMVQNNPSDVLVEYLGGGGRINFMLPCDPDAPVATVAVLPSVRANFEAALAASSPTMSGRGRHGIRAPAMS